MTDCIMPDCDVEATESLGMCEPHYFKATQMSKVDVAAHIEREHYKHPASMEAARQAHEAQQSGTEPKWMWTPTDADLAILKPPKDLDLTQHVHFHFEAPSERP